MKVLLGIIPILFVIAVMFSLVGISDAFAEHVPATLTVNVFAGTNESLDIWIEKDGESEFALPYVVTTNYDGFGQMSIPLEYDSDYFIGYQNPNVQLYCGYEDTVGNFIEIDSWFIVSEHAYMCEILISEGLPKLTVEVRTFENTGQVDVFVDDVTDPTYIRTYHLFADVVDGVGTTSTQYLIDGNSYRVLHSLDSSDDTYVVGDCSGVTLRPPVEEGEAPKNEFIATSGDDIFCQLFVDTGDLPILEVDVITNTPDAAVDVTLTDLTAGSSIVYQVISSEGTFAVDIIPRHNYVLEGTGNNVNISCVVNDVAGVGDRFNINYNEKVSCTFENPPTLLVSTSTRNGFPNAETITYTITPTNPEITFSHTPDSSTVGIHEGTVITDLQSGVEYTINIQLPPNVRLDAVWRILCNSDAGQQSINPPFILSDGESMSCVAYLWYTGPTLSIETVLITGGAPADAVFNYEISSENGIQYLAQTVDNIEFIPNIESGIQYTVRVTLPPGFVGGGFVDIRCSSDIQPRLLNSFILQYGEDMFCSGVYSYVAPDPSSTLTVNVYSLGGNDGFDITLVDADNNEQATYHTVPTTNGNGSLDIDVIDGNLYGVYDGVTRIMQATCEINGIPTQQGRMIVTPQDVASCTFGTPPTMEKVFCNNMTIVELMEIYPPENIFDNRDGHLDGTTIRGTNGNDLILASDVHNYILGGSGDDCIIGGAGHDKIRGNQGNDMIYGQGGNDRLLGGKGNDQLFGGSGNDNLQGYRGNDTLSCGAGIDVANGGGGTDTATADCETIKKATVIPVIPTITSVTLNLNDSNRQLIVTFTEAIDVTPATQVDLSKIFVSSTGNANEVALTGATINTRDDYTRITITLTEAQRAAIIGLTTPQLDVLSGAFQDTSGNFILASIDNAITVTPDTVPPIIIATSLNLNDNNRQLQLLVTFSETIDTTPATQVDLSKIFVSSAGNADEIVLTGATVSTTDGTTITITLTEAQKAILVTLATHELDVLAGAFQDISGNLSRAVSDVSILVTADTTPPIISVT